MYGRVLLVENRCLSTSGTYGKRTRNRDIADLSDKFLDFYHQPKVGTWLYG